MVREVGGGGDGVMIMGFARDRVLRADQRTPPVACARASYSYHMSFMSGPLCFWHLKRVIAFGLSMIDLRRIILAFSFFST